MGDCPMGTGLMDRIADLARRTEAAGFPGIWLGDSLGRGRPTLDPLSVLAALSGVTRRVELGISVLQLPLRNAIELAHRVQSVQALSGGRLVLGIGSGSTRDDFELLGYDYDTRFRAFRQAIDTMRKVWNGEPVNGGRLVDVAGLHGRSADPDRGLAQPALDHLRREGNPGLDPVGPLQHARRPRRRDEDLPRGRRHQRRAGECLDRPEGASAIGRAGEGCRISI